MVLAVLKNLVHLRYKAENCLLRNVNHNLNESRQRKVEKIQEHKSKINNKMTELHRGRKIVTKITENTGI